MPKTRLRESNGVELWEIADAGIPFVRYVVKSKTTPYEQPLDTRDVAERYFQEEVARSTSNPK